MTRGFLVGVEFFCVLAVAYLFAFFVNEFFFFFFIYIREEKKKPNMTRDEPVGIETINHVHMEIRRVKRTYYIWPT